MSVVRLKGADKKQARRWRREQEALGYLPHYHKIGRVMIEVRFVYPQPRNRWAVLNLATRLVHEFRKNGTPLNGTRGILVGPIVVRRRIRLVP